MSIKNLFLIFRKNDYDKELRKKITSLERNIEELEQTLRDLKAQNKPDETVKTKDPPIIIEKINIEKIILDKYELNNNFGQLGIKELKGKLNIGATYGSEFTPNFTGDEDDKVTEAKEERIKKQEKPNGPKVNIKPKDH
ncbi:MULTISPECIES: hypothetical protein [Neobacillus]|uniref:Uncharacterized protein n=1 Tax=Neobacillus citreus TaxID=2833578 RepID=A0A9J6N3D3_9BACI|nr:hypothetical protein [Neobacillus citreus]MCH6267502.1 hypothetical protein [Neobacillus citreus]